MAGHGNAPAVGILYESDEWSDHKLAAEVDAALRRFTANGREAPQQAKDADTDRQHAFAEGTPLVQLINMEDDDAAQRALACQLLVSRVFASSQFRGHQKSLVAMGRLIDAARSQGLPMLNEGKAHFFEIDKNAATRQLAACGIPVPVVYHCNTPEALLAEGAQGSAPLPLVVKPNCGGRSTLTAIAQTQEELASFLKDAPAIDFLLEEYVAPERGFLTRIEIVDGNPALVVKRSVEENGLSGYHHGSSYLPYPDCPSRLLDDARRAAQALGFTFGSFDVIEAQGGWYFIDANSVSNVSEDCTELLGMDLMAQHAAVVAQRYLQLNGQ